MGTFNWLLENLDPLAQLLFQALFRSLWLGLLIAALVWTLLRAARRASATTRHAVWLTSLLIIAALPFVAIATRRDAQLQSAVGRSATPHSRTVAPPATNTPPSLSIQQLMERRAALPPVKTVSSQLVTDADRASQIEPAARMVTLTESAKVSSPVVYAAPLSQPGWRQRAGDWLMNSRRPLVLLAAWLIGCALMLSRIAHSYFALFQLRRRLNAAPVEQQARVQYLADLFGVRRAVRLFVTSRVKMPMTAGSFHPIIVLPAELARTLSENEFDSVVAHELAHIKRWDYLTNLLQRLAQAFLFFHPAVWFIGRQLMIERELACDDWAVKMCEPRRYASCLTRLVEILSDSRPLAAAAGILFGKHVISRRVEMILNRDRNATTAVSKPAVVYALGLAAMLVAVCSLLSPVIAIPLGQQAKKQKKEVRASSPTATQLTPLPPLPPEALPVIADVPDFPPDAPIAPLPPEPELLALEEAVLSLQDPPTPVAPAAPAAPVGQIAQPAQPTPPPPAILGPGRLTGALAAAPGSSDVWVDTPGAVSIAGWAQDDKNKTPVIPEAEMLSLLTDIVKRDTDPNVRNEALQGIYHLRSDAAINTLIQLYDSVSDPKTKGEIIAYMLRRTGDNSKAIAKLTQIAKSESNEELRNRAIRYLGNVKGDDGANNLIAIYDSLQDAKMKQYVIRSLASNKSTKAVEKLKQIAKNDADPQIRSAAIRSLYSIDSRLYVETIPPGARIGMLDGDGFNFAAPRAFEFDSKRWEEMQREWELKWKQNQDKYRELFDKFQFDGLNNLRLEMPKLELRLKELQDRLKDGNDINLIVPLESQLRGQVSQLTAQVSNIMRSQPQAANHPTLVETLQLLNSLQSRSVRMPRATRSVNRVAPTAHSVR